MYRPVENIAPKPTFRRNATSALPGASIRNEKTQKIRTIRGQKRCFSLIYKTIVDCLFFSDFCPQKHV
jgi:hypothetical protein